MNAEREAVGVQALAVSPARTLSGWSPGFSRLPGKNAQRSSRIAFGNG
jgi:hypothetical protein